MLITPSFKKSLIVEQFQGNYLKLIHASAFVGHEGGVRSDAMPQLFSQTAAEFTLSLLLERSYYFKAMRISLLVMAKNLSLPFTDITKYSFAELQPHAESCVTSKPVHELKYQTKIARIVEISAPFNVSQYTSSLLLM